jgi:hypothetical protein
MDFVYRFLDWFQWDSSYILWYLKLLMLFFLWKTGIMHCYVVASFHSFKSYDCILWSTESSLFHPTAVDCGWCVARTHCIYVDQYVLSEPNLLHTNFSIGFKKCNVTPCHECCSIQNKQIVVYNVCEVCIILPIIALIISLYVNQYFICFLLKYCTWNDPFIFGDWWKLIYLLPVLDSLGFDHRFWIFGCLFIGWELSLVCYRIVGSRMVELVTCKDCTVTGSHSIGCVR